jgi:hypothetical protein
VSYVTHANVSLLTALTVTAIVFMLGYARAVMARANRDYKNTKAAVKPLQKAFWSSTWTVLKIGFGVVLLLGLLVTWNVRDVRDGNKKTPFIPAEACSPSSAEARRSSAMPCSRPTRIRRVRTPQLGR